MERGGKQHSNAQNSTDHNTYPPCMCTYITPQTFSINKKNCLHAHTPQQISSCTCTHLNVERYKQKHVCTYVTMLLRYSSSVETVEANSGKGDSVKTIGAYHWLLSSEGGWRQKERKKEGGLTVE